MQNKLYLNRFHHTIFILIAILITVYDLRSQIVIKDTVSIVPKRLKSILSAPPIIGGGYTATYEITSTNIGESRARKILATFGNETDTVLSLPCQNVAFGGVFAGSGMVQSFSEIQILSYRCEAGVYVGQSITRTEVPDDSLVQIVWIDGKIGGVITLRENAPMPFVQITYPGDKIFIDAFSQDIITARETHAPVGSNEPEIHWLTDRIINTQEYYERLKTEDTIALDLSVEATNVRGTARHTKTVLLIRSQLITSFLVDVSNDTLSFGDTVTIRVQALDEVGKPVALPDDYGLIFYLDTQGEQSGSFLASENGAPEKSLYDIPYGDARTGTVRFIVDGEVPDTLSPITIGVVNLSLHPKGGFTTVMVRGESTLDHFEVTFERDTTAFTESAKIFVQAKDANDQDIEFPADKLVKLSVITNTEYGTFIDKNNDTLKTTPVKLEHIQYGDANAGLIQFSAVKKNPVDPLLCKVKVELESDPTKVGEKEIPVVEQTLKIVMKGERKVVPMNLRGSRTPQKPKTENKKEFTIQHTRNKAGVKNSSFFLSNDNDNGTGGHDHVNDRPAGTQAQRRDNYGYYILKRTNDTIDVSPYDGQTQDDGREKFDYVASVFGDRMRLRVETTQPNKKQFLWDTLSVAEKVDGLTNFALITSDIWRLTGNVGTTSYRRCSGTVINHPSNHFVTVNTSTQLQAAIRDFAEWSGSEKGGGEYLVLGINDMSLIYGGLFDICSDWTIPGHQSHRRGTSVDIDGSARRYDGQGFINLNSIAPDGRTLLHHLTIIMQNHNGTKENEEPIHYNFTGR